MKKQDINQLNGLDISLKQVNIYIDYDIIKTDNLHNKKFQSSVLYLRFLALL